MKKIQKKHSLALRWFHWINFPVLALMIWSGTLIYWAYDPYAIKIVNFTLFKFYPESFYKSLGIPFRLAEGMSWHFALMWIFTINGILYFLYTMISGEWKLLIPNKHSFKEAWNVVLHDIGFRKDTLPLRKFNGAQQIAYTTVILMGFGSLISGLAIYKPIQFSWLSWLLGGYKNARIIHFGLTIGYVFFFMIHIAQVIRAGWNNFRAMVAGFEVIDEKDSTSTISEQNV